MLKHRCYCGVEYDCPYCHTRDSYICPTLNDDEDGNMCDACLVDAATDMQAALDEFEDEGLI